MSNIYEPEFDEPREREGFRARRARIGRRLGSERIGISPWESIEDKVDHWDGERA